MNALLGPKSTPAQREAEMRAAYFFNYELGRSRSGVASRVAGGLKNDRR